MMSLVLADQERKRATPNAAGVSATSCPRPLRETMVSSDDQTTNAVSPLRHYGRA
jgi:hypothetical protein